MQQHGPDAGNAPNKLIGSIGAVKRLRNSVAVSEIGTFLLKSNDSHPRWPAEISAFNLKKCGLGISVTHGQPKQIVIFHN